MSDPPAWVGRRAEPWCGRVAICSLQTFINEGELVRFGRHFLPSSFKFTSIQLNHNFASALHVDDYNSGPSVTLWD